MFKATICFGILAVTLLIGCKVYNPDNLPGKTVVLRLNPGKNNPRNSEGDFITLTSGRMLFVYSHYTGTSTSDHAPACLAARFSDDGGKSWTQQDKLIVAQEGELNVMSVSLLRLHNGHIALFYLKKNSTSDCIPMMRISTDEAETWGAPAACITDQQGYFVLNNNRVIQLENGRLLMPVALHKGADGKFENKATLFTYFSDDNGGTWRCSQPVPNSSSIITQEPGVVELNNGTILMFIRATGGVQQFSYSNDKGETWSHIVPGNIKSPLSPASMARIPSTGDLLLVWNNNDGINPSMQGKRTPLTLAVSDNDGKTWKRIKNLEDDPDGWYCYTAIHFTKDAVLLGYCAGSQSMKTHLSTTQITKIKYSWIYKQNRVKRLEY